MLLSEQSRPHLYPPGYLRLQAASFPVDATHHWQQCSICGEKGLNIEHNYSQEDAIEEYLKAPATTTSKAIYHKSCVCGVKGTDTFESGKILGEVKNLAMSSTEIIYGDTYSVNCDNNENVTIEYKYSWTIENGGEFKFKYDLQSQGAHYSIRILKKGIKGDNGFVRSVQFTTGHESTGEYSDTFALPEGDYYLEIAKYESATIVGPDTVALYYSYES